MAQLEEEMDGLQRANIMYKHTNNINGEHTYRTNASIVDGTALNLRKLI